MIPLLHRATSGCNHTSVEHTAPHRRGGGPTNNTTGPARQGGGQGTTRLTGKGGGYHGAGGSGGAAALHHTSIWHSTLDSYPQESGLKLDLTGAIRPTGAAREEAGGGQ